MEFGYKKIASFQIYKQDLLIFSTCNMVSVLLFGQVLNIVPVPLDLRR